jgi:antitoxin PrlF
LSDKVTVTRKYQVTIPESVRKKLSVKIGDKLIVKSENNRIIMENPNHVSNPSDTLWNLFGKSIDIDAVKMIEQSWDESISSDTKKRQAENRKEAAD